jgi:PAS domain S-box-containing protein
MNAIALIDLFCLIGILAGILIFSFKRSRAIRLDIRILIIGLFAVTLVYVTFMFIEWIGISHSFESSENMVGAMLPIMWLFVLYAFVQQNVNTDLKINKENLRITLNSIGDAVITTDTAGRVTRMNPVAENLTGWQADESIGKQLDFVFPIIDSNSRERLTCPVKRVIDTGEIVKLSNQTILVSKNGKEFHITDSAAPILNKYQEIIGVILVFSDITEKYLQNQLLRESEERLKLALYGTKAGIWDWHIRSGDVVYNQQWAEMLGYDLRELEPLSIKTRERLIHPEDLIRSDELLDKHFKGLSESYECEIRMKHKAGHWIWVLNKGKTVAKDKNGNPTRLTGTQIEISAFKNAESELQTKIIENQALADVYMARNEELMRNLAVTQKVNKELREAKRLAEENDRLKSGFLANMSHEIRTPMNGIIGFSSMLMDPEIPADKRKYYAKIIVDSGKQLLTIVNDILDISRIETGKVALLFEELKVNDLMSILYAFFEPQTSRKNLVLQTIKSLNNTQSKINTDKTRLRQILTNLLNNAVKFTNEGSISFGYTLTGDYMQFFVEDTGIGIPEDLQEKIFEPFSQAEQETSNQYEGTGLGLSISHKLVDLLGGKIWVESEVGKGSKFYFTVPYNNLSSPVVKVHEKKEKAPNMDTSGLKILVAEDDDINYLYLEAVLSKMKIRIVRAHNGLEAVDLCKKNPEIQMVFMDIKMPFMNGLDATKKIKELYPDLPVIAQTAYAMNEDKSKVYEAGCDGYISKPIRKAELIAFIERYCGTK